MKILVHSGYKVDSPHSVRPEAEVYIALARKGHEITIVTQPGEYEYFKRFQTQGLHTIGAYPKNKIDFSHIQFLRKELKKGYDIAYGYNSKTIPNLAFAAIGLPTKVIAYRGTVGGLYRYDPSSYLTALHPRVDAVIAVSNAVRDDVRKRSFLPNERVITIYKGHDIQWYDDEPKTDLTSLGISKDAFTVICAANARPSKGIEILLDAFGQLSYTDNIHLVFAGNGFEQEPYQSLINSHPLKNQIHLLGHRNDIIGLMKAADVQVQPSIKGEGLPKTIIEAMGGATPSIVTTTGGGKELILEGKTGFVVPTHDAMAIAKHLGQLIANPSQAKEMGQLAKERLKTEFSLVKSIEEHEHFFKTLIS
ncbi:glycosyltransferase family 4 protein [Suttonella ornithocola]|uniref:GDP-mannose-dependent alpha-(1-2)-phosphatidylinositol mannosyltransferase n=1 Tax=Suttonella ornithocola TaxID=279832 RepID=A0A380MXS9_9GAMM|nr:glycosyltransferase family 4 protein [Suttonella ornithocola]SUO96846.1 GDP-mannose-dependent alpha-(1-2)-phosphatidylinositol mannosyltransferase [Suttonella ornithocola]